MSYRSGTLTGVIGTLLVVGGAAAGWWLLAHKPAETAKSSPPPVPATVPKTFKEDAVPITLDPTAEQRLGVRTGEVERKSVPRVRVYGGEVVVPPGRSVAVAAPLAGTLRPATGGTGEAGHAPKPGEAVKRGQTVFLLSPLLDPVGRANLIAAKVETEGKVAEADEALKGARVALDRQKKVLAGGAGSQRLVDEAQNLVDVAAKNLATLTARRDQFARALGDAETGTAAPIPVEAPEDGVIRTVAALPGQTVPSGAALFEVVNLDFVWVRVPVYAGDLPEIDSGNWATVGGLAARPGEPARPASFVAAPPSANPASGTVDLFYQTLNWDRSDPRGPAAAAVAGFGFAPFGGPRLVPGQRVGATLPLADPRESLTVPWSAVVYDIHGGAWVYEKTAAYTYVRKRVVVRYVTEGVAVLDSGPREKTKVVTAGAAELFGAETGYSK